MSNLPELDGRRKPVPFENPRATSGRPKPPAWLVPRANQGQGDLIDQLIEDGATMEMVRIVRYLDRSCERYHDPGTWVSQKTIAESLEIGRSTTRVYLKWLESNGYVARSQERVYGRTSIVIWCLWLLPSNQDRHTSFDLGEGVFSDGGSTSRPRKTREPKRLVFAPDGADSCAQDSAPKNRKWISVTDPSASASTSTAAPGENTEEPGPTVSATAVPIAPEQMFTITPRPDPDAAAAVIDLPTDPLPAAAVLTADEVGRQLAILANPKSPARKFAFWRLEEGGQLPAEYAGLFPSLRPDSPARQVAPRNPSPAIAVTCPQPLHSSPAPIETTDLIRRLAATTTDEDRDAQVEAIALRLGKLWDEMGSINGFKPRLRQAAAGDIPLKVVLKAFTTASRAQPNVSKGAIFHKTVNDLLGDRL